MLNLAVLVLMVILLLTVLIWSELRAISKTLEDIRDRGTGQRLIS
jgi:hypothetical protein